MVTNSFREKADGASLQISYQKQTLSSRVELSRP
jgi:hypothetical protein